MGFEALEGLSLRDSVKALAPVPPNEDNTPIFRKLKARNEGGDGRVRASATVDEETASLETVNAQCGALAAADVAGQLRRLDVTATPQERKGARHGEAE